MAVNFTTVSMAGEWSLGEVNGQTCAIAAIIWRNVMFRRFGEWQDAVTCWNALCNGTDPLELEPEADFSAKWFKPPVEGAH